MDNLSADLYRLLIGLISQFKEHDYWGILCIITFIYFLRSLINEREEHEKVLGKMREQRYEKVLEQVREQQCALNYVRGYSFPKEIELKLQARYPHLKKRQAHRVIQGLRRYFLISRRSQIAMPSHIVDTAWQEFMLFSKDYTEFSQRAFGHYFRHIPVSKLDDLPLYVQASLMNAWECSCYEEDIDPDNPQRLPLLFALDTELAIAGGVIYSIEAGHYPRTERGIPPYQLIMEIEKALPLTAGLAKKESVEWEAATNRLAAKIKLYLFEDDYCEAHGRDALARLFDSILEREDLTVALFGDIALAKARLSKVRKLLLPKSSCNSYDGSGGCGGS